MTTQQIKDRTKDVTRRFGWWSLRPGDKVWAVEKSMGIPKGEKIKRLALIEIVSTRKEPLNAITHEDCEREGFPEFIPADFVRMLADHQRCPDYEPVNRIEFKYLD